jgi:hypothetical protein
MFLLRSNHQKYFYVVIDCHWQQEMAGNLMQKFNHYSHENIMEI